MSEKPPWRVADRAVRALDRRADRGVHQDRRVRGHRGQRREGPGGHAAEARVEHDPAPARDEPPGRERHRGAARRDRRAAQGGPRARPGAARRAAGAGGGGDGDAEAAAEPPKPKPKRASPRRRSRRPRRSRSRTAAKPKATAKPKRAAPKRQAQAAGDGLSVRPRRHDGARARARAGRAGRRLLQGDAVRGAAVRRAPRFQAPAPPEPWDDVRDATELRPHGARRRRTACRTPGSSRSP